jgi:hypothetical protein
MGWPRPNQVVEALNLWGRRTFHPISRRRSSARVEGWDDGETKQSPDLKDKRGIVFLMPGDLINWEKKIPE